MRHYLSSFLTNITSIRNVPLENMKYLVGEIRYEQTMDINVE